MVLIGRRFFRHTKTFIGPSAQINAFAPLTAKRTVCVLWAEQARATAGGAFDMFEFGQGVAHLNLTDLNFENRCLGAERHFKGGVFFAGDQLAIGLLLHQSNDHQESVATDFWREIQAVIDAQTQQLEVATLR